MKNPSLESLASARRNPSLSSDGYLVLKPLANFVRAFANDLTGTGFDSLVVDLGCGEAPYKVFFESRGVRYLGVDMRLPSRAEMLCASEQVALRSSVADRVICTQTLEHVDDPSRTLCEIARILKPGGAALVSTHGVFVYHPNPNDFWRWTEEGLRKQIEDTQMFRRVDVFPCCGTIATLFYLWVYYVEGAARRVRLLRPLKYSVVPLLNAAGEALDRIFSGAIGEKALIANFVARLER